MQIVAEQWGKTTLSSSYLPFRIRLTARPSKISIMLVLKGSVDRMRPSDVAEKNGELQDGA
jgi:hypothetical protein